MADLQQLWNTEKHVYNSKKNEEVKPTWHWGLDSGGAIVYCSLYLTFCALYDANTQYTLSFSCQVADTYKEQHAFLYSHVAKNELQPKHL